MAKQKLQASPQISNGDPLVRFNNLVLSDLIVSSFEYMRPVTAWFISFLNRYTIPMGPILFLTVSRRVHQNNVLNDKDYICQKGSNVSLVNLSTLRDSRHTKLYMLNYKICWTPIFFLRVSPEYTKIEIQPSQNVVRTYTYIVSVDGGCAFALSEKRPGN